MLAIGETITTGDEYLSVGGWKQASMIGAKYDPGCSFMRRKHVTLYSCPHCGFPSGLPSEPEKPTWEVAADKYVSSLLAPLDSKNARRDFLAGVLWANQENNP